VRGVRARAGVGARGERPENTLVCTERPFAAGEFVFFHFCSTFSQAASCLVSATLNNNNNQHKKKKKEKEKKERKKEKKPNYFSPPGSTCISPSLPFSSSLPRVRAQALGWAGAASRREGGGSSGGARTLGSICISQVWGGWWL
jgi:hypothetical protein